MIVKKQRETFKKIAATRPYYVSEKICEIYESHQKNTNGGINIDIDCYNDVWALYPTLIEYSIQYLLFMDFEFANCVHNHSVMPPNLKD